jgi:hypothetical protein
VDTPTPQATAPVRLDLQAPLEVARWRPFVHWILAVPHYLVLWFLEIAQNVCVFIGFFAILFTKRFPPGLHRFVVLTMRYQWRVSSYAMFMRETYPPFEFEPTSEDASGDPATLSIDYPEELQRFMPLVKWFLAIPHYVVLVFLVIGAFFAGIGAFFGVLFTGRYPEGIRRYFVGLNRWITRVTAYVLLLRDEYPPFSMQ